MSQTRPNITGHQSFPIFLRWGIPLVLGFVILLIPIPNNIAYQSWVFLAIFIATMFGNILQPTQGGVVVLLGITVVGLTRALPIEQVLYGYADRIVWLVLAALFISRGVVKTGLGRRIALMFVSAIGHRALGLGYALILTDMILAMLIPSTGARCVGIIYPITKSIAETYEVRPTGLRAFLMILIYQCDVIICGIFLFGQASNGLIAEFAGKVTGIELSYGRWMIGAIVPGLICLGVVPLVLYRFLPPGIRDTPAAADYAKVELHRMGTLSSPEKIMLLVFTVATILWLTSVVHGIDVTVIALLGVCVLLLSGVLEWQDIVAEPMAWGIFIWYGGLVGLAGALEKTGITRAFANAVGSITSGLTWWTSLAILLLIYFYAHYFFASITAHVTAMYIPFLLIILAAGVPPILAVLSLAYFSNLSASLTHYGTTSAPIYYASSQIKQRTWWMFGLIISVITILIWTLVGFCWWKILGWW